MAAWRIGLLLIACLISADAAAQAERRIALVIGNGAYREAPLRNPVNDARAMALALEASGFVVTKHENADRLTMQRAVLGFGKALSRDAVGLFYYAGHGMQVRGTNYLVPINAQAESEDEVEVEAVDVNYVLARMATAENRLNIVILDACRDNPFARAFRSGGRGLAAITAPTGTLIAYATAPGSTAADGGGLNGLYTGELIGAIAQGGLRVEDVFKRTRLAVVEKSRGRQTPWESSSLMGDFYFQHAAPVTTAPAPRLAPAPAPTPPPSAPVAAMAPSPPPPAPATGNARSMHALDCPAPGLTVRTSAGERLTAIAPNGSTCRWRNAQGHEFANVGPFLPLSFGNNHTAMAAMRGLELGRIGAEVRAIEDDGSAGSFTWRWHVAARGPVTVGAGTFDAVLVEAVRRSDRAGHESVRRYWYAPALRIVVKYEAKLVRGAMHGEPGDWEVTEVTPAVP